MAFRNGLRPGFNSLGHYGYNKMIVNQFNTAQTTPWAGLAGYPATLAAGKGGDLDNGMALWNQTRSYWPDIDNYYEDTPSNKNHVVNPAPYVSVGGSVGSATPTTENGNPLIAIAAQPQTALGIKDSGNNSASSAFPAFLPLTIPTPGEYYGQVGTQNLTDVPGGQTPIPGGNYYADKTLADKSVFNFYKNLLDGPNKKEWQKWNAINVSLEQTFFDDRLGLLFVVDHQSYTNGTLGWLNSGNYGIFIDINATYANGAPNPNVGRPYVGNAASAPGLNYNDTRTRNTFRFTPTYELRFEDLFGNTTLAKILGKSIFTGLYEDNNVKDDYYTFGEYATDPSWGFNNEVNNQTTIPITGQLGSNREFDWVAYIGPSLLQTNTAHGQKMQRLNYVIAPPTTQTVLNFNSTWNRPDPGWNALPSSFVKQSGGDYLNAATGVDVPSGSIINLPTGQVLAMWNSTTGMPYYVNPAAPPAGYVDPGAPFTYTSYTNGQVQNSGQYNNAANYQGWITESVTWMNYKNPTDFPSMVESAARTRYRDISDGFTYQGYFLNGDLVPTFGWRKDKITSYDTNGPSDPNTGFTSLVYPDDLQSRTDVTGRSKTWGGVYHLPKFLTSKLPGDTTISLFFDHSDNFKADASRLDLSGKPLPNSSGVTREYGFTINTLQDKLSLKVDWFRTTEANATLDTTSQNSIAGMGGNAYFLADGAIWGWAWATDVQLGLQGLTPNNSQYDAAGADGLPKNTPAQLAAYNAYNLNGGSYTDANGGVHTYIGGNAIVNAWLNAPFPSTFFSSYNLSPGINPTLAKASGQLVNAYVGGVAGGVSGGVPTGGGSQFGNHQTTVTNVSSGYEVEMTYQPVKNWNLTVNYSHVNAVHENVDPVTQSFMASMTQFMNGPGGQVREWYNGGGSLGAQWNSSLVAPYTVELNEQGHEAPEVSPWRLNLVTTYQIDHGIAKGVFFGGGLRIEAGRIIGYAFDSTFKNVNSSLAAYQPNPTTGMNPLGLTLGGLNINKTFMSSSEHHVDLWVGYNKKITRDINWRIALNLKNFGEKDRLVAARINPDGAIALERIEEGMGWQLTNTFSF